MMKTKNNHYFMKSRSITMQEIHDLRTALAGGQYKYELYVYLVFEVCNLPAATSSAGNFYARQHRS